MHNVSMTYHFSDMLLLRFPNVVDCNRDMDSKSVWRRIQRKIEDLLTKPVHLLDQTMPFKASCAPSLP